MKTKLIRAITGCGLAVALTLYAVPADKTVTITGSAACAKCTLQETKDCQATVTAKEDGKDVMYYLQNNDVAKKFGKQFCKDRKNVKVTGSVQKVGDKLELIPTEMELVAN